MAPPVADVVVPDDHNAEIKILPDTQQPFGADSRIDRRVQSAFFHYNVAKESVLKFCSAIGLNMLSLRLANPATEEGRVLFNDAVKGIQSKMEVMKLKLAVDRLCLDQPFEALRKPQVAPSSSSSSKAPPDKTASQTSSPPDKGKTSHASKSSSSKSSSKSSTSSASRSSASSSKSSSGQSGSSGSKPRDGDSGLVDVSESDSDSDVDDAAYVDPAEPEAKRAKTGDGNKCLNQLFSRVASDVSFVCFCLFPAACYWFVCFVLSLHVCFCFVLS